MRKKVLWILVIFVIILLSGCSNEKSDTKVELSPAEEFYNIAVENDYYLIDKSAQYAEYDYIKYSALINKENQVINFFVVDNENELKYTYDYYKNSYEKLKSENDEYSTSDNKKYSYYELITSDKYMYVVKNDNTILFTDCDVSYKNDIIDIIEKLGYYKNK